TMAMTSSVPYLLRAINEWIIDNGYTPYLILDAAVGDTSVPMEYVKDGQIVLNISATAIRDLVIGDDHVAFSGRFGGVPYEIYAPMEAVMGIVAKENGEGMWFPREEAEPEPPPKPAKKNRPPDLKVIK
ncbi:MAG: ClpXP protease specificity-enhancing factor, partial [Pseudomonadales bacterium]|nr:ClpXP protease specificity-enhancing factor [Pseudomonadales bacterium]